MNAGANSNMNMNMIMPGKRSFDLEMSEECLLRFLCLVGQSRSHLEAGNSMASEAVFGRILSLMSGFALQDFFGIHTSTESIVDASLNSTDCKSAKMQESHNACPILLLISWQKYMIFKHHIYRQ